MKPRIWSKGELDALQKLIDDKVESSKVYNAFPYRSIESIRHKIRCLKSKETQQVAETTALETLISQLREVGPIQPSTPQKTSKGSTKELEICIMDPHFGMQCYDKSSDHPWNMDLCEEVCLWAIDSLIDRACPFGPFSRVVFPFGNDFLHADNIQHTTTAGTFQPEMLEWHQVYRRGKELAIKMVERLKTVAPVKIYEIPGNHSLQSDYTLGLLLDAYYHRDETVEVDCSPSPYKFHRFGCNLLGFEHGSSIAAIRLAAIMANERPTDWAETTFREFHLGDQHRKGASLPSMHEEQGVSIEYIPGITPPNAWHRSKAFNFQKRGAVGFVWDEYEGQLAKLCVNLDPYTGKPMGV